MTRVAAGAATGATRLVESLAAAGVRRIFTLSGNQILSVFDATIGRGVELVHTRHEAAAVHMADAYARENLGDRRRFQLSLNGESAQISFE